MIYKNAEVFFDGSFQKVDIEVKNGFFSNIKDNLSGKEIIECEGKLILPGFIDIHTHGCIGHDFNTASIFEIEEMCRFYGSKGVTSVLATTMTIDNEIYKETMKRMKEAFNSNMDGSRLLGINMEGPFLGADKKGAHDANYLHSIDYAMFEELNELSGDTIRMVDLDPNLNQCLEFIEKYSKTKVISIAHTSCDYDMAVKAIEAGASNVTHLFNAMNALHHRNPGIIGAVSDFDVHAEIICDGIHIHPSVIRLMFKVAAEKMILISDSMSATGLQDGIYWIGGQKVFVKDSKATLEDGTIAGSTTTVYDAMIKAIGYGVPREQAILSATLHPAKTIHVEDEIGSIAIGKKADFILMDPFYKIEKVYRDGLSIK